MSKPMFSYQKICWLFAFAILVFASVAQAGIVVDASVSASPGGFSYSYNTENQTAVGILGFSLDVTGDVGTIGSPAGWVSGTAVIGPGETLIDWVSTDVPFDVPAFGSLSGFMVASTDGPGTVAFSTLDENFNFFDGSTTGPVASAVPEPGSFVLFGLGLLSLLTARQIRRPTSKRAST
jgi:hypothetical protein